MRVREEALSALRHRVTCSRDADARSRGHQRRLGRGRRLRAIEVPLKDPDVTEVTCAEWPDPSSVQMPALGDALQLVLADVFGR